jgi:hypothetical protein
MFLHISFKTVLHTNNTTPSPPRNQIVPFPLAALWASVIPDIERMKLNIHILDRRVSKK